MRIPIPLVLLLCLVVMAGVWWCGSRHADFVTPPSASKLAEVRLKVESSLPPADHPVDAVSPPLESVKPTPPPPEPPKPAIELGDLSRSPMLQDFHDAATRGAPYLIELAGLLEAKGETQRALLAWERVIDLGNPNETQTQSAITAIKRLRPGVPDWKPKTAPLNITLHAGTAKKNAKSLKPMLEETARDIEHASAGILKVTVVLAAGRDHRDVSPHPTVAIWFTGSNKTPRSTAVFSFAMQSPDTLRADLQNAVFQIVRGYLGRGPSQTPPSEMAEGEAPLDALTYRITRLFWADLGTLLNHPPA